MDTNLYFDRPFYDQANRLLAIPRPTLIVLCGPSGCGKSTFANTHFQQTAIVSTDNCRSLVSDDSRNMECSDEAFDLAYNIVQKRLKLGRTTVFDSTALSFQSRQRLREIAKTHDFMTLLLILETPLQMCFQRDAARIWPSPVGKQVLNSQFIQYQETLQAVQDEGFDAVVVLDSAEINKIQVRVEPLSLERAEETGPFDIIGDVHGCLAELQQLLMKLNYSEDYLQVWRHPEKRKVVFLGDIIDRGPASLEVLRLVGRMVKAKQALYIPGNHCYKFYRYLEGHQVKLDHGLETTVAEFLALSFSDRQQVAQLTKDLIGKASPYLLLNKEKLVVTHAGIKANMLGRLSKRIFNFCLYGNVTNEESADGLPVREDWAAHYQSKPLVVYAHTPTVALSPVLRNNTVNLDQGCVYGGRLTAMRYPEQTFVQVEAAQVYYQRTVNAVSLAG